MSFIPAVNREIAGRNPNDPIRIVLEYLLANAIGHTNPVSKKIIVAHLATRGITMNEENFQQIVVAESRASDFFIGSGPKGYFLIQSLEDAQQMRDFYETRIAAEQTNLANLRRQSRDVHWNI